MNRLENLFKIKDKNILSLFFTAGYPDLESTVPILRAMKKNGIDMIEIGIPFSDPMADGPIIQKSSSRAISNGITLKKIFFQIKEARKEISQIPIVLMGYINPILKYGIENFFKDALEAGVDALIIPDLPFDYYLAEFKDLSKKFDIPIIMLITPETSEERIHLIDNNCDGFIYMVSSASTTGTKDKYSEEQIEYFKRISNMQLSHKRLIGFGISNHTTFTQACENGAGAIIGSQFIKCLDKTEGDADRAVKLLLESIGIPYNSPHST